MRKIAILFLLMVLIFVEGREAEPVNITVEISSDTHDSYSIMRQIERLRRPDKFYNKKMLT